MYLFVLKQMIGWNHPHHEQSALLLVHNSLHYLCLLITPVQPVVKQTQPTKKGLKSWNMACDSTCIRLERIHFWYKLKNELTRQYNTDYWITWNLQLQSLCTCLNDHIMCSLIIHKTEAVTEQQSKYTCR